MKKLLLATLLITSSLASAMNLVSNFFMLTAFAEQPCIRDISKFSKNEQAFHKKMVQLAGIYNFTGKSCNPIVIEIFDECEDDANDTFTT